MNNIDTEQLVKEALYYINNKCTIEEVADNFNMSKRTIQLHFNKLREILGDYDPVIIAINKIKKENEQAGKIQGGKTGKRPVKYTDQEITKAEDFKKIDPKFSLRDLESLTGISKSTLHERMHKK